MPTIPVLYIDEDPEYPSQVKRSLESSGDIRVTTTESVVDPTCYSPFSGQYMKLNVIIYIFIKNNYVSSP